jgi:glycerol-3-phosphate dehydrogenase (NAD(P)+)
MKGNPRIAILGSGSWATALVKLLLNNVNQLNWYLRHEDDIKFINKYKHNPKYLTSILFDTSKISFYSDLVKIIKDSDLIIIAIPAPFLEETLSIYKGSYKSKFIVSAVKGIIPGHNLTDL